MAIICREHKILYIQVPGTGCTVVGKLLVDELGGQELGRKHNDVPEIVRKGLCSPEEIQDYLVIANIRNPFDRFVTYYQRLDGRWIDDFFEWARKDLKERLESGEISSKEYQNRLKQRSRSEAAQRRRVRIIRQVGFNTWMLTTILRWRFRDRASTANVLGFKYSHHCFPMLSNVDIALRQEALEDALNVALKRAGISRQVRLPRRNLTKDKEPYTSYYNRLSRSVIERLYRGSLKTFGYQFEGVDRNAECVLELSGNAMYSSVPVENGPLKTNVDTSSTG